MPTVQEWWQKSELALGAAHRGIEDDNLPATANRLWYTIYQGVHAVLIHQGMTPRQVLGNWAHEDVPFLYALEVCRAARTRAGRASLNQARGVVGRALAWRIAADYTDHAALDRDQLRRALAQIARVLQYMEEECLR